MIAFGTPHDSDNTESKLLECMKDCFQHQRVYLQTHYRGNQTPNVLHLVFTNEETMIEGVDLISHWAKVAIVDYCFCSNAIASEIIQLQPNKYTVKGIMTKMGTKLEV